MTARVIDALRQFLPAYLAERPPLSEAQKRAIWAIQHCRTEDMGGHLYVCVSCKTREFHYHSCNHRCCPQCGKQATAEWIEKQLEKRVGAPYFMVTFTLPKELRPLFFSDLAKEIYQLFFSSAARALSTALAHPRWLGVKSSGFSMVLHTWNQRLQFHPHIHCLVPGAGIANDGRVVSVKSPHFLVPQPVLRRLFREHFREGLTALLLEHPLPNIPYHVWQMDWGIHLQAFGTGENIIKYLGRYVCRTAIGDSRIISISETHVSFRYKDRAHGDAARIETLTGVDFVARYLRHVLPRGLRAIRHYGICHSAAKVKRERVAFHTGCPLRVGALTAQPTKPPHIVTCPCCQQPMLKLFLLLPAWSRARPPPPGKNQRCA